MSNIFQKLEKIKIVSSQVVHLNFFVFVESKMVFNTLKKLVIFNSNFDDLVATFGPIQNGSIHKQTKQSNENKRKKVINRRTNKPNVIHKKHHKLKRKLIIKQNAITTTNKETKNQGNAPTKQKSNKTVDIMIKQKHKITKKSINQKHQSSQSSIIIIKTVYFTQNSVSKATPAFTTQGKQQK